MLFPGFRVCSINKKMVHSGEALTMDVGQVVFLSLPSSPFLKSVGPLAKEPKPVQEAKALGP